MWEGIGSIEEEDDALEQNGFRDGVDLLFFGAIKQTNRVEREKEKERQAEEHQTQTNINKKEMKGTYAWKMHEHVACNNNNIMGSAQSNPTSTHDFIIVNTHPKCMKHC